MTAFILRCIAFELHSCCLSNAVHSIGQSIKSPLCPYVRPCVRHFVSYLPSTFPFPSESPSPFPSPSPCPSHSLSHIPFFFPSLFSFHVPFPFPGCHGNEIWDKMSYNSARVRDFREIFAPVGGFSGTGRRMLPTAFFHDRPPLTWQRNLGQNWL